MEHDVQQDSSESTADHSEVEPTPIYSELAAAISGTAPEMPAENTDSH
jgi:hypothetical protein